MLAGVGLSADGMQIEGLGAGPVASRRLWFWFVLAVLGSSWWLQLGFFSARCRRSRSTGRNCNSARPGGAVAALVCLPRAAELPLDAKSLSTPDALPAPPAPALRSRAGVGGRDGGVHASILRARLQLSFVTAMFDSIAVRYDWMNVALSMGQTSVWRWLALGALGRRALPSQARVLDVGTGTGAAPRFLYCRYGGRGLTVDAMDPSEEVCRWRAGRPPLERRIPRAPSLMLFRNPNLMLFEFRV